MTLKRILCMFTRHHLSIKAIKEDVESDGKAKRVTAYLLCNKCIKPAYASGWYIKPEHKPLLMKLIFKSIHDPNDHTIDRQYNYYPEW